MAKDPTAFRKRFKAYKDGKSVKEIYDAGLPKYYEGTIPFADEQKQQKVEQWSDDWQDRLQRSAGSKVLQKWNATGEKPKPESQQQYTARRVKETTWNKPSGRIMLEMAPAAVDFVPGAGNVKQGLDATAAGARGNYVEAGFLGAGLLLPTALKKPLRAAKKYFKNFMQYKKSPLDVVVPEAENQKWSDILSYKIADREARLNPIRPSQDERAAFRKAWDYVPDQRVYDSVQEVSDITGYTGKQLSDFVNIINDHPEFYLYVKQNKIRDPFNQKTISDFLNQQYTSKRGVVASSNNEAIDMITATDPGRRMTGGDRLSTYGGLYTTNHSKVSDRFKNPEGTKVGDGYVGTVRYRHNIPTDIPLDQQLERYRRSILLADQRNPLFGTKYYDRQLRDARFGPDIVAIQSDYVGRSGHGVSAQEMAYLPKGPVKQHPVDLLNLEYYPNQIDKHGRWGQGVDLDVEGKQGLFIPIINNRRSDYVNAARQFLKGKYNNTLFRDKVGELDALFESQNRRYYNLLNDKYEKQRKLKNIFAKTTGIGLVGGMSSALGYGLSHQNDDFYKSPEYEAFLKDPNFNKYADLDDGGIFKLSSLGKLEKKYERKYRKRMRDEKK